MGLMMQIPQFSPLNIPALYHRPQSQGSGQGGLLTQLLGGGSPGAAGALPGMGAATGGGLAAAGGGAAGAAGGAGAGIASIMPELLQALMFM